MKAKEIAGTAVICGIEEVEVQVRSSQVKSMAMANAVPHQSDDVSEIEVPLVLRIHDDTVQGAVDYKGRPIIRCERGYWRAALFLISVEVMERFVYYGIQTNLISYLTGPLRLSTAAGAENVNVWVGTGYLLPLFGAFIADSYLGRYRTVVLSSLIYTLGLGLLTLSAMLPSECQAADEFESCSPRLQQIIFFVALYLTALGLGGHKPCIQAFAADQFDEQHPKECKARSSFFTWWNFSICAFGLLTVWILNYIQDNLSWVLGLGIPCLAMIASLVIFLLGTKTYRFISSIGREEKESPFVRFGRLFVGSKGSKEEETNFSISEGEQAKELLRLAPIWAVSLVYGIVTAQIPTFFIKQGVTLDRTIFPGFDVPAASLQSIIAVSIALLSPIYDRIFVPIARAITGKSSGITMLQRIGTGIFVSVLMMVTAALVEMKRLKTAEEYVLVDKPNATVPLSLWWLIPQYLLFGVAEVFTMVGLQEFFYDQVPNELRSIGLALNWSIYGVGNFLSSFLILVIEEVTGKDGQGGWFANNLNKGHLDYFYWLIAGLSGMALALFICFAKSYIYNKNGITLG